ncbi:MAG: GspH/FimT family pseudopilin [Proteobacteria bacterium]|nr:GspH/FimT family pseudopilin [Pseudomonadota bacterium]
MKRGVEKDYQTRVIERRRRGFTVVEIMVTLAVAGILVGFALPAFNNFLTQRALTTDINDMALAIAYARSEAANRGERVSVLAIDGSNGDNEWGAGYCVTLGNPADCSDPLRVFTPRAGHVLNGIDELDDEDALSFNARGLLEQAVTGEARITLCQADETRGRMLSVNLIGRTSVDEWECGS